MWSPLLVSLQLKLIVIIIITFSLILLATKQMVN